MSELSDKVKELEDLIQTMDLPEGRKKNISMEDVRWILRNIGFRNSDHLHFNKAVLILKQLHTSN